MKKLLFAVTVATLLLAGCSSSSSSDATASPEATATPEATASAKPTKSPEPSASATAGATTYADGVYEGEAEGHQGPIVVTVDIVDGKIESVTIYSQDETESIAAEALVEIPAAIVANQTTDVDAISGATVTSKAIIKAVNEALKAAQ